MRSHEGGRIQRVPTQIPGLDKVLGGGLLRGGIYVVMGAPGSGKTILGNQICFANARRGGRSAYLTLLAESHARMMLHLESVDFFDPDIAGDGVRYLSAYDAFTKNGLRGVLDFLRGELAPKSRGRDRKDAVIVIDGFLTLSDASSSVADLKKFIQELQLYADLMGATVLLLAGPSPDQTRPEYTMVDGIVELREHVEGLRAYREIRVRKLRGVAHLRGGHTFEISNAGISVYPRVEALYASPSHDDPCSDTLVGTGVADLDRMIGGGLRCGTSTLVLGPSGSGKTTLGLHAVAATPRSERAVIFGFYETPRRLVDKAERLGLKIGPRVKRGDIEIVWQPSTEQNVDALAERLLGAVDRTGATRLLVDGLDGLRRATIHPSRLHHVFTSISNELRTRGVTSVYTVEVPEITGPTLETPVTGLSSIAENLIYLRFSEHDARFHRTLSVLKVRDANYEPDVRELRIGSRGLRLAALPAPNDGEANGRR